MAEAHKSVGSGEAKLLGRAGSCVRLVDRRRVMMFTKRPDGGELLQPLARSRAKPRFKPDHTFLLSFDLFCRGADELLWLCFATIVMRNSHWTGHSTQAFSYTYATST